MPDSPREHRADAGGAAFLLAQIGAHAAGRFAARIAALDLTPPQAGLLRAITRSPGDTQQRYAELLGVPPSRFVHHVDELERRGLIERRRRAADRRAYGLYLTGDGEAFTRELGRVARTHDDDMTAGLSAEERRELRRMLAVVAEHQGLTPGVHPGYRTLPKPAGG